MMGTCRHALAVCALLSSACDLPKEAEVQRVQLAERVCAEGPQVPGIDVSSWQGDSLDWDAIAAGGDAEFAFIRVMHGLEGDGYNDGPDLHFDLNWAEARRVGLLRGAYQYFITGEDPIAQADFLINKIGQLESGDLPPVIDVEVRAVDAIVPVPQIIENVAIWLDRVENALGVRPIIYTSQYMWEQMTENTELFADYPLWVAHYNTDCPLVPGGWSNWSFHQYSSTGGIVGYEGDIDKNIYAGTLEELQAMAEHPEEVQEPDAGAPVQGSPDAGASEPMPQGDLTSGCSAGGGGTGPFGFFALLLLVLVLRRRR